MLELDHPPIRPKAFLEQSCYDEEYWRPRAWDGRKWVTYVRGKHGGGDWTDGAGPTYAVWDGTIRHVDFGPSLGEHQFVLERSDGYGFLYAHTSGRPRDGKRVRAGKKLRRPNGTLVRIGASGTVFKHLHGEVLKRWNDWFSCTNLMPACRRLQKRLREAG